MKTLIESMRSTRAMLRTAAAAHRSATLEIIFHEDHPFRVRRVTEIAPHLIMFKDPNAPVNLTHYVAEQHKWPRGMTRTYTVSLMTNNEAGFDEIARAFDGVVMSVEDISTDQPVFADIVADNADVCYDEECFRQTCAGFGIGVEEADNMMLKLETGEGKKNIGWIILKIVPSKIKPNIHTEFLMKYVEQFKQMVEA